MTSPTSPAAPLTDEELSAIIARAEKATPGPWQNIIDDTGGEFTGWPSIEAPPSLDAAIIHRAGFKQEYWGDWSMREANANATFIAAARSDVPRLAAELRRAREAGRRLLATINPGNAATHKPGCMCVIHEARAAFGSRAALEPSDV
jgi:hypothetical protein